MSELFRLSSRITDLRVLGGTALSILAISATPAGAVPLGLLCKHSQVPIGGARTPGEQDVSRLLNDGQQVASGTCRTGEPGLPEYLDYANDDGAVGGVNLFPLRCTGPATKHFKTMVFDKCTGVVDDRMPVTSLGPEVAFVRRRQTFRKKDFYIEKKTGPRLRRKTVSEATIALLMSPSIACGEGVSAITGGERGEYVTAWSVKVTWDPKTVKDRRPIFFGPYISRTKEVAGCPPAVGPPFQPLQW